MKTFKAFSRSFSPLLSFILLLSGLALPSQAQNKVIIINADQPNVWTLEQAHYLLAQMHRRNLDLKAKSLEDLDANEIAGLRFDVVRMLIEFGATFNQADLAANRMFSRNQEFNTQRREELTRERDQLRKESLSLTGEIDDLETEKADAGSDEEKARLDAKIASKKNRLAKVDKEIENINGELATVNVAAGELRATTGGAEFNAEKLPKSVFDDAFKAAAAKQIERFNEAPKVNASLKLDNFLQMQYEIIAKQLSLLRDEVGPGERLLFLELPQTVNVAHHEANKKWAQSWWKIAGYTRRVPESDSKATGLTPTSTPKPTPIPSAPLRENQKPITTAQDFRSIFENEGIYLEAATPTPTPTLDAIPTPSPMLIKYVNDFIDLDENLDNNSEKNSKNSVLGKYLTRKGLEKMELSNRLVRTVELIPRQSSLNVNDMKMQVRSGAFSGLLSTLFGFGARLNIQRQREQFSQFVQQELYSSAFGKGSREFGWTFTPMPGTDRLLSGVRTTYAVLVVPEEATSIVLEANGCYFPRSAYQPNNFDDTRGERWNDPNRTSRNCNGKTRVFVATVPSGGTNGTNDYWVKGISYQPVPKGRQITVLVSGDNFSSQVGVLINGVPLIHSIGLAQPLIRDDSKAGEAALRELQGENVRGRIERVDSNKIVFSFEMPPDFEGTPTITLVAPGKAIDLNWLENVDINGVKTATLSNPAHLCGKRRPPCVDLAEWMFGKRPVTENFRIDNVEIFSLGQGQMKALIHGAGFKSAAKSRKLYVNGIRQEFTPVSPELIEVFSFPVPVDPQIQVTLVYNDDTIRSQPIPSPAYLRIDRVRVVSYEPETDKKKGILVVRISGVGFTGNLEPLPSKLKLTVTSSTEAFLTILIPTRSR